MPYSRTTIVLLFSISASLMSNVAAITLGDFFDDIADLFRSSNFAKLASNVEDMLGCNKDTVFADEMNRVTRRGFDAGNGDGFCPGYLVLLTGKIISQQNNGAVDEVFDAVGDLFGNIFGNAGEQTTNVFLESLSTLKNRCTGEVTSTKKTLGSCQVTIHECMDTGTGLSKVITDELNCITNAMENAQAAREAFNSEYGFITSSFTSTVCEDQTKVIEANEDLRTAFLTYTIRASERTIAGGITEFVQYVTTNTDYKVQCASNSGSLKELNVNATCKGWDSAGTPVKEARTLVVGSRPRCYGIDCIHEEDERRLFEVYTLRLTEEAWMEEDPSIFWACRGQFADVKTKQILDVTSDPTGSSPSPCKVETAAIGEIASMRSTYAAIDGPDPVQKQKKILGVWSVDIKNEFTVSFTEDTSADAFGSACTSNGGEFASEDFVLKCERKSGSASESASASDANSMLYEVSGFPMCAGQTCGGAVSADIREPVVRELAREKLAFAASLSCTITTSGSATKAMVLIPLMSALLAWLF